MASARQIRDEIMKMTIVVNSDPAQKAIYELNNKTKELTETNVGLAQTLREVEKERKKEETAVNSYAEKIDRLKLKLRENQSASIEQIKMLQKQQSSYDSTSREFQAYQTKIDAVRAKSKANTANLESAISSLVSKQGVLIQSYEKNSAEAKRLNTEIKSNKTSINEYKNEVKELTDGLDINQMTMGQLRKEAALLKTQLNHIVDPKSAGALMLNDQLDAVNARMNQIRTGANQTSLSFRNLAERFNHYQGIALAATAVLVGFGVTIQNIIDRNNKMADAMSGVEKTTGMARKEVEELTRSFSDFDTRTKKVDLLKIAEVGGRLGVAKEDIKAFTLEVDKANVALGDGFEGGVEQVTNSLGKLQGLYSQTRDLPIATSINQIGSAMNELGAAGAASEANIADFALRVGSLPENLKPTIAEALALGAAFEESGLNAERSATAYSTFIRTAATNTGKFAEVMKMSKKEVDELINKDPLAFFLKFSEGMKGMDPTKLSETLAYLKLNDQYVISAVGAASENTDRFRKSIELSNKSLTEATSLQEEFNKVNNNAAAIYEKVQRKITEAFTSKAIADFINGSVTAFGKFIGVVEDVEGRVTGFRDALFFLTKMMAISAAGIISYNVAIGTYNGLMTTVATRIMGLTVIEKARGAYMAIATGLQNAYNFTVATADKYTAKLMLSVAAKTGAERLNTAATNLQASAQQRLNAITKANPLGLIIGVIMAAVAAYQIYKDEIVKTGDAQNKLNKILDDGAANAAEEITNLDLVYKKLTDKNLAEGERLALLQQLQKQFPGYFDNLTTEDFLIGKAAASYRELRDAIISSARADAAREELKKQQADRIRRDVELERKIEKETENRNNIKGNMKDKNLRMDGGDGKSFNVTITGEDQLNASRKRLKNYNEAKENNKKADEQADKMWVDAINANDKRAAKYKKGQGNTDPTVPPTNFGAPTVAAKTSTKTSDSESRRLERLKKQYEEEMNQLAAQQEKADALARQIALDREDAVLNAMAEGFEKELALLQLQEKRKIEEIDKQKIGNNELTILQEKIDKAKADDKKFYEALMKSHLDNNAELEKQKLDQEAVFNLREGMLAQKFAAEDFKKQEENFKASLELLKRQKNESLIAFTTVEQQKAFLRDKISTDELEQIRTFEEGKAAIEKYYTAESLKRQVDHLQQKINEFNALVALNQLGALDPEQLKNIEAYKNEIAELLKQIDELKGKGKEDKFSSLKKGGTDILGLNPEQWKAMFTHTSELENNLSKVAAAIGVMQNMQAMYFSYVEANQKKELQNYERATETKKRRLLTQLQQGYINQETYKKLTIKADQDLEKKKAELALKAAKRERAMQIASAISGTAVAVVGALGNKPWTPLNFVLAGLVGALGALQLGTILSQPLPTAEGYEDGFGMEYPIERQQDGKRFNVRRSRLRSGLVDRPTHFIAGENNKLEMVIDTPTWTSYSPQLKSAIHSANARAKGFETGFNTSAGNTTTSSGNDEIMLQMMAALNRNSQIMERIEQTGITAIIGKTARNGKEIDEMRQEYLDLKNKNKH